MARMPIPGSDFGTWGTILNNFLSVEMNPDGTLKADGSLATKANNSSVVHNTGDENVAGQKTFSTSPIVPTPTQDTQVANKSYADTKATKPIARQSYMVGGDVVLPDTGGVWTLVGSLTISIPAVVGDWVELNTNLMFQSGGSDYLDIVVMKSGSMMRRASSGTTTPAQDGDTGLYPSPQTFRTSGSLFAFTVTSDDLDGGSVNFAVVSKGSGGAKIFASSSFPMRWRAINMGAVSTS